MPHPEPPQPAAAPRRFPWRRLVQYRLRTLVILTTTCAVGMSCWCGCTQDPQSRIDENTKLISESEWPESLSDFIKQVEQRRPRPEIIEVYYSSDDEYYWKCKDTPELLSLMTAQWRLSSVDKSHRLVPIVLRYMPTALRSSIAHQDIQYYLSEGWLEGEKGRLYAVIHDKKNNRLIVRYYFNF